MQNIHSTFEALCLFVITASLFFFVFIAETGGLFSSLVIPTGFFQRQLGAGSNMQVGRGDFGTAEAVVGGCLFRSAASCGMVRLTTVVDFVIRRKG